MKLASQVSAGLAVLLLLTFGLVSWQLLLINRIHSTNQQLASADLEVSRTSLRIRQRVDRVRDLTQRFLVLRDRDYPAELERQRLLIAEQIEHLQQLPLTPVQADALVLPLQQWEEYRQNAEQIESIVVRRRASAAEQETLLAGLEGMHNTILELDAKAVSWASDNIETSSLQASGSRKIAIFGSTVGLLLTVLLATWISRSTVRPLLALTQGSRAIAAGEFAHQVEAAGPSEVQSLAHDFNRMAERLGELDRSKRDFISNVSHDLKAPLASIQETTSLMLEQPKISDEQRHLLQLNADCAERLQRMIADLLEVARFDTGPVEFGFERVDLVTSCRQAIAEAGSLLDAAKLQIIQDWPADPVMVRADPRFLMQVLWNLISNAVKFSPEGGEVRASVQVVQDFDSLSGSVPPDAPAPPAAIFSLADQGIGIPDAEKPLVFDRFYRSRRHERFASGTGLGLAICRAVVDQLGGVIWVEDAVDGGSLFQMLLPVATES